MSRNGGDRRVSADHPSRRESAHPAPARPTAHGTACTFPPGRNPAAFKVTVPAQAALMWRSAQRTTAAQDAWTPGAPKRSWRAYARKPLCASPT